MGHHQIINAKIAKSAKMSQVEGNSEEGKAAFFGKEEGQTG